MSRNKPRRNCAVLPPPQPDFSKQRCANCAALEALLVRKEAQVLTLVRLKNNIANLLTDSNALGGLRPSEIK